MAQRLPAAGGSSGCGKVDGQPIHLVLHAPRAAPGTCKGAHSSVFWLVHP